MGRISIFSVIYPVIIAYFLIRRPLFLDFNAFHSNPTFNDDNVEVPAFESSELHFVDVTNQGLKIEKNLRKATIDFWSNIEGRAFE